MIALLHARCSFVGAARSSVAYCRAEGIDWSSTVAATGGVFLADILVEPGDRFDFAWGRLDGAVEAAVIEALDADGETTIDIVAWPVGDPGRVLTMLDAVALLGEANARNPATYVFDAPLRLFRRPLDWLRAGCDGAVVIHPERAARILLDLSTGLLAAEDDAHARDIEGARQRLIARQAIVVPARVAG